MVWRSRLGLALNTAGTSVSKQGEQTTNRPVPLPPLGQRLIARSMHGGAWSAPVRILCGIALFWHLFLETRETDSRWGRSVAPLWDHAPLHVACMEGQGRERKLHKGEPQLQRT